MGTSLLNRKVIIRSDKAGVFFGKLTEQQIAGDKLIVKLENARCLWRWSGCSLLQVANDGYANIDDCKFTVSVKEIVVTAVDEIIPCTDKAINNIKSVPSWTL